MKTNKILAVALSAGLVLGGASVANAGGSSSGGSSSGPVVEEVKDSYDTKEKAEEAAKKALENDSENNDFVVYQGNDGKWNYELKIDFNKPLPKPADDDKEDEEPEAPAEDEEAKDGYDTKEEAEEAAKKALKNDDINKSFKVSQGLNGKWIYTLSPYEEIDEEAPAEEEEEDQTPKWMKGLFTKDQLEDALATARGELIVEGLQDSYDVEAALSSETLNGEPLYAIRRVPKKVEEEKPEDKPEKPEEKPGKPWLPLVPADPVPGPGYPNPVPGGDNEVVIPGEKPADKPEEKPEDNKETEIKEEKPNEGKDKDEKAKPSKDKKEEAKPAKQKGNNPKTGLVGLAPIYSTLAISMAGIVAARKKND